MGARARPCTQWHPPTHGRIECMQCHYLVDEMIVGGLVVETNPKEIIAVRMQATTQTRPASLEPPSRRFCCSD